MKRRGFPQSLSPSAHHRTLKTRYAGVVLFRTPAGVESFVWPATVPAYKDNYIRCGFIRPR